MRRALDEQGNRLFKPEECLKAQQIRSFFAQTAAAKKKMVPFTSKLLDGKNMNEFLQENETTEQEEFLQSLKSQAISSVCYNHSLIFDRYNICELLKNKEKFKRKFSIAMLLRICEHFEINVDGIIRGRKESYVKLLMEFAAGCECAMEQDLVVHESFGAEKHAHSAVSDNCCSSENILQEDNQVSDQTELADDADDHTNSDDKVWNDVPEDLFQKDILSAQALPNATPKKGKLQTETVSVPVEKKTKVSLTVQYPSKTIRKELIDDFAILGKAIAHGSQRIARAALKNSTVKKYILEKVLKLLTLQSTLNHLAKLKVTCCAAKLRGKLYLLGENDAKVVLDMKTKILLEQQVIVEKEATVAILSGRCREGKNNDGSEHICNIMCNKEKKNAMSDLKKERLNLHAGFAILFDNIDGNLNRWHMTMENQNLDFQWVNHKIVINRVSGNKLHMSPRNVLNISNIKLLPPVQDQRQNYIVSDRTTLSSWQECL
ncbi:Hypothetical predicted protein [Paramuricea clavata]|uniref:Uncharacterized protein n=1 Tax=Paramuricea clavata TaxID=317549 RepID=A0A6S7GP72_PARCT|nr:Hypothetical predicted protein [Paramuricea clavata]